MYNKYINRFSLQPIRIKYVNSRKPGSSLILEENLDLEKRMAATLNVHDETEEEDGVSESEDAGEYVESADGYEERADGYEERADGHEERADGYEEREDGHEERADGYEERTDKSDDKVDDYNDFHEEYSDDTFTSLSDEIWQSISTPTMSGDQQIPGDGKRTGAED